MQKSKTRRFNGVVSEIEALRFVLAWQWRKHKLMTGEDRDPLDVPDDILLAADDDPCEIVGDIGDDDVAAGYVEAAPVPAHALADVGELDEVGSETDYSSSSDSSSDDD